MTAIRLLRRRPLRAAALAVAGVCLAGVASGCSGTAHADQSCGNSVVQLSGPCPGPDSLRGDVLRPPDHEPDIVMKDTSGSRYNIETANPGKNVLLYFGYTHCPDICPALMADTASALRQLSPAVRAKYQLVFITVDPVRDTPRRLARWLHYFSPSFVGLRAPVRAVIAAQKAAGVPVSKIIHGKHYTVQHSAELLVYSPDHEAHVVYTLGPTTVTDLTHDLPLIAAKTDWQ